MADRPWISLWYYLFTFHQYTDYFFFLWLIAAETNITTKLFFKKVMIYFNNE